MDWTTSMQTTNAITSGSNKHVVTHVAALSHGNSQSTSGMSGHSTLDTPSELKTRKSS